MKLSYKQKYLLLRNTLGMIFITIAYAMLGYKALMLGGIIC